MILKILSGGLDFLGTLSKHWRVVGVILVTGVLALQTVRYDRLQTKYWSELSDRKVKASESKVRGALSSSKSTNDLLGDEREDTEINARVRWRIRNVCMHDADENGVLLPDLGGLDDRRSSAPSHIPVGKVLIRAMDSDLRTARSEFNERRRLNEHLKRISIDCGKLGE